VETAPPFALAGPDGARYAHPAGRPTLLCFVKLDCPTCVLSLPWIEAAHQAFEDGADVWLIAQDPDGGERLRKEHPGVAPVLDDSALRVSWAYRLETVPTVVLVDESGGVRRHFVGFGKSDWQGLLDDLASLTGLDPPRVEAEAYPEARPGCGSRSVDPAIAERLAAEAAGSPLRARRIEIAGSDDPFEFLFDQGLTDGLPVVPPTPERVLRMLEGTKRDPQEEVAVVAPNLAPVTVEKVAINAVMAGCRPEYLPVVIAAVEATCSDEFNLHGVLATTYFAAPVLIVNGPIRNRIGMNAGMNVLGQGNRANATIGRAVQLVVRNVGGGRPGEVDRATFGQPGKYTLCFAELEERSPWPPLHVERGFAAEDSAVSVYAGGAPVGFIDQASRDARSLATSYGLSLMAVSHPKFPFQGEVVVLVSPEHVDTFARDHWSKDQIRAQIQEVTSRPLGELVRDELCAEGIPPELAERLGTETRVPKFRSGDVIHLVVCGGEAGKFGAYIQPWVAGPMGSIMTTRKIGD
jgi:hypothetical protein